MSKEDYAQVEADYAIIREQQKKCGYRTRKILSTSSLTKYFCCCMKVKDRLNLTFDECTEKQKKHRIKTYWKKAKRVFLFQRLKLADEKFNKNKEINNEDDGDDILENINSSAEHEWKWYIIRQENTLPQIWQFLTNMLTIYALFVTPFVLVFSDCS